MLVGIVAYLTYGYPGFDKFKDQTKRKVIKKSLQLVHSLISVLNNV